VAFGEVWDRFNQAVSELPPQERPSWNPPVTDEDLSKLEAVVSPRRLPPELVELLRRADGTELEGVPNWLCDAVAGDFQTAAQIVHWRRVLEEAGGAGTSWSTAWIYLTRRSHSQALIELVDTRPAMILDATVGGLPRPLAPSLSVLFAAITDFIAEGHAADFISTLPLSPETSDAYSERVIENTRWFRAYYQQVGWNSAPFRQFPGPATEREEVSPSAWPLEWRD
jgi:hypothetical protein